MRRLLVVCAEAPAGEVVHEKGLTFARNILLIVA